ncbi:MAG: hypothetical protein K9L86_07430 [Candidatus Omnitrophica bacterium]|nr:hypothetical protein [Candidatus Omnitrophota bacterium]
MKVEVKKIDKLKRKLEIKVSGEEFLKEKKEAYQPHLKSLKVPGFRPGAAPIDIIEKHHGALLRDELLKRVLPIFYGQALKQESISPAGYPEISDVELTKDALSFSAELEARPEIEVTEANYKGIKIKDKKIEIKAQDIEKVITNLQDGVKKVIQKSLDDEELSRWASYPDSSFLREAIKGQLFVEKLRERKQKVEQQIRTHLLKAVKIDIPKSEVEYYHKQLLDREIYNLQRQGIPEKDIDKYKDDLKEKLLPMAEEEIKLTYVLEAVAKKENIKTEANLIEVVFGFILSQAKYE